mgnify:CR=1 FL=1
MSEDRKKTTSGTIRNKERTKQRMIEAVGEVLKEKGYPGLTINNIVNKAKVDRKLVAHYFGDINNLIEEYLNKRDYWMSKVAPKIQSIVEKAENFGQNEIVSILHTLYDEISKSADLQRILSWEISERHDKLRELADNREALGTELFNITDKDFKGTNINLRAILALQIAGIYYLILHASVNGSTFCGIDVNTADGQKSIKEALVTVVDLVYKDAVKNN